MGFLTGEWKYAWLIFLANPIFDWLLNSAQPKDKQPQKMAADDEDDDMLDF
jgi:hypothetical protein